MWLPTHKSRRGWLKTGWSRPEQKKQLEQDCKQHTHKNIGWEKIKRLDEKRCNHSLQLLVLVTILYYPADVWKLLWKHFSPAILSTKCPLDQRKGTFETSVVSWLGRASFISSLFWKGEKPGPRGGVSSFPVFCSMLGCKLLVRWEAEEASAKTAWSCFWVLLQGHGSSCCQTRQLGWEEKKMKKKKRKRRK